MLSIAGILLVAVLIAVIDVPPLWRRKLTKELWIFSLLLLFGTAFAITHALHIKLPNPLDFIILVYKPVADRIDLWLK